MIDALIREALKEGYDVTITLRQRKDTLRGDLILPLSWARLISDRYEIMSDPALARIGPRAGCDIHRAAEKI